MKKLIKQIIRKNGSIIYIKLNRYIKTKKDEDEFLRIIK